jgi:hypothetical protein
MHLNWLLWCLMILCKNNDPRLFQELETLEMENKELTTLLLDMDNYIYTKYGHNCTITHLFRLDEEQELFYKNSERYKKKPFTSPHQYWHSVDISSRGFTQEQIEDIVNYINNKYNKENYYRWTIKWHNIGFGSHFHIQFTPK